MASNSKCPECGMVNQAAATGGFETCSGCGVSYDQETESFAGPDAQPNPPTSAPRYTKKGFTQDRIAKLAGEARRKRIDDLLGNYRERDQPADPSAE